MSPEGEIIVDLLSQIERSVRGLHGSTAMLGIFPATIAAFDAMEGNQEIASTAMLKQFEQLEDALSRLFRTALKGMGIRLKGLYPMDIANHMIDLDVLDDAEAWVALVKLRNELVHEYPLKVVFRFERTSKAYAAIPMLVDAARRVRILIDNKGLLG